MPMAALEAWAEAREALKEVSPDIRKPGERIRAALKNLGKK
jgi:hypothetical protein